jgi:asparagine synthase (glutamine-hydrolysing)
VGASTGHLTEAAKDRLYSGDAKRALQRGAALGWLQRLFAEAAALGPVDRGMAVDVASYLPYDLLVKVDITAMIHALEPRAPFLDHEVMELAARLPESLKLRGRVSKYLLRQAFADLIPPENLQRSKAGFGVPVGAWLRGPLRAFAHDTLLSSRAAARGYFEPAAIERVLTDHATGRAESGFLLWTLLMLELWHLAFVDRTIAEPAAVAS